MFNYQDSSRFLIDLLEEDVVWKSSNVNSMKMFFKNRKGFGPRRNLIDGEH